jgi:hypothetical protein
VRTLILLLIAAWCVAEPAIAADDVVAALADTQHAQKWNRFARAVVALQAQQLADRRLRTTEKQGEYGGEMAKGYGYRESEYADAVTGQLLGRLRRDRDRADFVQSGEVYIHDDQGRVLRDYAFIYLPWAPGAPIRTFINLHDYRNGLHAYRQFDASGTTTYESCEGTVDGHAVAISLPEERVGAPARDAGDYRTCFAGLPTVAGRYLMPQ